MAASKPQFQANTCPGMSMSRVLQTDASRNWARTLLQLADIPQIRVLIASQLQVCCWG